MPVVLGRQATSGINRGGRNLPVGTATDPGWLPDLGVRTRTRLHSEAPDMALDRPQWPTATTPMAVGASAANTHHSHRLIPLVTAIPAVRSLGPARRRPGQLHAGKGYDYPNTRVAHRAAQHTPYRPPRHRKPPPTRHHPLERRTVHRPARRLAPPDHPLGTPQSPIHRRSHPRRRTDLLQTSHQNNRERPLRLSVASLVETRGECRTRLSKQLLEADEPRFWNALETELQSVE